MKYLIFISLLMFGCASQKDVIHEDTLYITRKYIGDFIELRTDKKATCIMTSDALFYVHGKPELNIPDYSRCYVKYIPEKIAGSMSKYWVLYFTWDGTEDLFMIKQNWITGDILR